MKSDLKSVVLSDLADYLDEVGVEYEVVIAEDHERIVAGDRQSGQTVSVFEYYEAFMEVIEVRNDGGLPTAVYSRRFELTNPTDDLKRAVAVRLGLAAQD